MTREEHLLTILAEECNEVAQRCSKALRFGLKEVQDGDELNNADRISDELADLLGVMNMLVGEGYLNYPDGIKITDKKPKVEKYLMLSEKEGELNN